MSIIYDALKKADGSNNNGPNEPKEVPRKKKKITIPIKKIVIIILFIISLGFLADHFGIFKSISGKFSFRFPLGDA